MYARCVASNRCPKPVIDLTVESQLPVTNVNWHEARAYCAYAGGRIYHLNAHGRLVCLDAAGGREVWSSNVLERFEAKNITWALSECLLVDRERVIVTPGGRKALMAALEEAGVDGAAQARRDAEAALEKAVGFCEGLVRFPEA